jgi:CheY-like chemotaxis protein
LSAAETGGSIETQALSRRKVLVMDDEAVVRDSVGEMLEALGQDVEFAQDGASAVERQ